MVLLGSDASERVHPGHLMLKVVHGRAAGRQRPTGDISWVMAPGDGVPCGTTEPHALLHTTGRALLPPQSRGAAVAAPHVVLPVVFLPMPLESLFNNNTVTHNYIQQLNVVSYSMQLHSRLY